MPKYRVYGIFTGSKFIGEFEADSPDEAEQLASASSANHVSLCLHCSRAIDLADYSAQEFDVEEVDEETD